MRRTTLLLLGLSSCLLRHESLGETVPTAGRIDSRVRLATYDANEVYRLRGYLGYQIDIEFESGEAFTGLGAGDIEGLSFVGKDNHLFLKPKAMKVATNVTILTSRRQYQLDYSALPRAPGPEDEVIYALRFAYPPTQDQSARQDEARRVAERLEGAADSRARNIDYWYCGDPALKPTAASDNGVHTRLSFAANAELPAVFVRNDDTSESLLNFSMDAGDVILHRVARRLILRRGRLTGCIVNQAYAGSALRLKSGTVASDVQRKVQGGSP